MRNATSPFGKRASALIAAAAVAALAIPGIAAAQSLRPLGTVTVEQIIGRVISGILGILGSISLLMFVYGGILWMTAAGNDEKIKKAKNTIVYAVLGLVMAFLSYTIVFTVLRGVLLPQVQAPVTPEPVAPPADQPATNS